MSTHALPVEADLNITDRVLDIWSTYPPSRCFGCGKVTEDDDVLEVLNGIYHRNCFSCQFCRKILSPSQFSVEDGRPSCDPPCGTKFVTGEIGGDEKSLDALSQPGRVKEHCYTCGRQIDKANFVRAFDGIFHNECFRCQSCQRLLKVGSCTVVEGKLHCDPFCETVMENTDVVQTVMKRTVPVDDRLENMVRLRKYTFSPSRKEGFYDSRNHMQYDEDNKPKRLRKSYSSQMFSDGQPCFVCGNRIPNWDRLILEEKSFHRSCFRCRLCNRLLSPEKFQLIDGERCCHPNCLEYHQSSYSRMYVRPSSISNPTARNSKPISFIPTTSEISSTRISYQSAPVSTRQSQNDLHVYEGPRTEEVSQRKRPERAKSMVNDRICYTCKKKVYAVEQMHVMDRYYHRGCFRCCMCNRILDVIRYSVHEGLPYCIPHHQHVSRNRSTSATNLRAHYSEADFTEAVNKLNEHTESPSNRSSWIQQQISRSQTAPSLCWTKPSTNYASDKGRTKTPTSPAPSSKVETSSYVGQDVRDSGAPLTSSTLSASKSLIEPTEMDNQFCYTCGRIVHPYLRIALPDKVFHPDCAKCYICQINLGLSNYRDFGGKLYCSPHFAQALAEFIEDQRRPQRPNSIGPIGRSAVSNLADVPSSTRPQTQFRNSWGNQGIEASISKRAYMVPSSSQLSVDDVSQMSNTIVNALSPQIPPRPRTFAAQAPPEPVTVQPTMILSQNVDKKRVSENGHIHVHSKCSACSKPVYPSTYISVRGKPTHFECLTCNVCGVRLNQFSFKELEGKIYCPSDYTNYSKSKMAPPIPSDEVRKTTATQISPLSCRKISVDKTVCYSCGKKVYATEALYVMERVYHRFCFKCQKCNGTLGVENYHVLNGNPYCKPHYRQLIYNKGLESDQVPVYLFGTPQTDVQQSIPKETVHYDNGAPAAEVTICRSCQQPVHPRDGIHILQQYYHYDCFKCEHCKQKLNMGRFEMAHGKAYCAEDFLQLFGRNRGISSRQSLMHLNELVRSRSAERQRSHLLKNGQELDFRAAAMAYTTIEN